MGPLSTRVYKPLGAVGAVLFIFFSLLPLVTPAASAMTRTIFDESDQFEPDGLITLTPDRVERNVIPGQSTIIPIRIMNGADVPVKAVLSVQDLEAADDSDRFVQAVKKAKFGASTWITPETNEISLVSGEQVELNLTVLPPPNAPVGANYAALRVSVQEVDKDGKTKVGFRASGISQLFLTVPGEVVRDTRIAATRVSDQWMFNGGGFVSYEVDIENRGNVHDLVSGEVVIQSLFGNSVAKLKLDERYILRGSTRTVRVIWTDPPRFGRFSGTATITGRADKKLSKQVPQVTVLPPWWWIALGVLVVLLPIGVTWKRRRDDWKQYLDDEDFDEDDSEWEALT